MERFAGYLGMMRIRDWIRYYPIFPLLGGFLYCGPSPELAGIAAIFFCATAFGFVVNNYYDVEIDRRHLKKHDRGTNPLAAGEVTRRGTLALMFLLCLVACAVAAAMSIAGLAGTVLCLVALALYSAPPFRLKDRAFIDIATHGLMFGGLPFIAGYYLAGGAGLPPAGLPAAIGLLCTIICGESLIAHQINDYAEDIGTSETTVVRFGARTGWSLLGLCSAASLLLLAWTALTFDLALTAVAGAAFFLVVYPVYSCQEGVRTGARSAYDRVIVATLQLYR